MTYRSDKSPDPRTATVLQDAVILTAGQQTHPDPEGKPTSVNVVTLLLIPEDAEKLVLATSLGAIHFVLRNGADQAQTLSPSVGLDQLTGTVAAPVSTVTAGVKPGPAKPKPYQVETILGDKQVVNSFN
jgi:pilus assembly protein CpaB